MKNLRINDNSFPEDIVHDIQEINTILTHYGADKVILYGSLARGDYRPDSDIDICVEGLPNKHYFRAFAECMFKTSRHTSVLDFGNTYGYLRERILQEGRIIVMNPNEDEDMDRFKDEVKFGLENLEKIYNNILMFAPPNILENRTTSVISKSAGHYNSEVSEEMIISALTYECFGYYNAIEHLIIRFLKYLKVDTPSGQFSHKETLRLFNTIINNKKIKVDQTTMPIIENLMAFRHVATKIYIF